MGCPEPAERTVPALRVAPMSGSKAARRIAESIRSSLPAWLDSSRYPIGVVDENGIVAYANEAALSVFGIPADRVLGRPASEFIEPSSYETYESHRQLTRRGENEPYLLRFGADENSKRDFLVP